MLVSEIYVPLHVIIASLSSGCNATNQDGAGKTAGDTGWHKPKAGRIAAKIRFQL